MDGDPCRFDAEVWEHQETAAWFFVSLPEEVADDIDERYGHLEGGFGSLRVEVTIGSTTWRTSVFLDTKRGTYLLPVKKQVRTAEAWPRARRVRSNSPSSPGSKQSGNRST